MLAQCNFCGALLPLCFTTVYSSQHHLDVRCVQPSSKTLHLLCATCCEQCWFNPLTVTSPGDLLHVDVASPSSSTSPEKTICSQVAAPPSVCSRCPLHSAGREHVAASAVRRLSVTATLCVHFAEVPPSKTHANMDDDVNVVYLRTAPCFPAAPRICHLHLHFDLVAT